MQPGLGSSTWWDEAEYKQLETANLRALFVLDKLIKRDIAKFQAAWSVAFPGRLMCEPSQIQPDEVTMGPWLVILTRMGATRDETTEILERVEPRGIRSPSWTKQPFSSATHSCSLKCGEIMNLAMVGPLLLASLRRVPYGNAECAESDRDEMVQFVVLRGARESI